MSTIFTNTTIVTVDPGNTVHYNAALVVNGDSIVAIGPTEDILQKYPNGEIVNCEGKALFPGLINCHTHLLATADKGILEDFGFPTTLKFPTTGRGLLNEDERNIFAKLACIEAIRSGTTTLLEISDSIEDYAQTLNSTGLRFFIGETMKDIDDAKFKDGYFEYSSHNRENAIGKASDLIDKWHGKSNGRMNGFVAPHAPETVSPELLRASRDLSETYETGYTIHLSQSYKEIEAIKRVRGVLPTHYLFANEFLSE